MKFHVGLVSTVFLAVSQVHCASNTQNHPVPQVTNLSSSPDASTSTAVVADAGPPVEPNGLRACGPGESPSPTLAEVSDTMEDGRWQVSETESSTGQPAPVVRACDGFKRAATTAQQRAVRTLGLAADSTVAAEAGTIGTCHYSSTGAWVLIPGAARTVTYRREDARKRLVEIPWTVGFVQPNGTVVRSTVTGKTNVAEQGPMASVQWTLFYDYDHDGSVEAQVAITSGDPEQGDPQETKTILYSFRQGKIELFRNDTKLDNSFPFDVDSDGVPDLALPSRYSAGNTCGPSIFYGPPELAHALPDGTFRTDDAVAQEYVRRRCYEFNDHPQKFFDEGIGEAPFRVACWRFLGVSAEALQTLIARDWPENSDEDHCTSREGTMDSIRRDPPFVLKSPCK